MLHRPSALALVLALAPLPALAVSGETSAPPTPTETTTVCPDGTVWNPTDQVCAPPKDARLDDEGLLRAARELAHAGRAEDALRALDAMVQADGDTALAVRGFALRRSGRTAEGMAVYEAALARNPDNLLARSYMGQALVAMGRRAAAEAQLAEIVARGGAGGWPEIALRRAIETGQVLTY